ncbi:hypothetical protein [Chitinimonas taiwanensis]|uniref:hypothetical protein n=1 Tax=Chitinimonas taiwanensis TaxID=240412 RepID=UPI0035AF4C45
MSTSLSRLYRLGLPLLLAGLLPLFALAEETLPIALPPAAQVVPAATVNAIDTPLPGDTPAAAEPVGRPRAAASSKNTRGKALSKRGKNSKAKASKRIVSKKKAVNSKAKSSKSLKKKRK